MVEVWILMAGNAVLLLVLGVVSYLPGWAVEPVTEFLGLLIGVCGLLAFVGLCVRAVCWVLWDTEGPL